MFFFSNHRCNFGISLSGQHFSSYIYNAFARLYDAIAKGVSGQGCVFVQRHKIGCQLLSYRIILNAKEEE